MADLTATQLSDLRADLGDIESAFTDADLERFYDRMDAAPDDATRYQATMGLTIRALLHDAAKFNDYTAGEVQQKKDQVFKHYKDLYNELYRAVVEPLLAGSSKQVVWAQLRGHPHQTRTKPMTWPDDTANEWDPDA